MQVTVELQAYLTRHSPDGQPSFECTLPEGATVQTLLGQLNLSEDQASIIVVNDRTVDFADPLHDGDRVILIPPLAGG